MRKEMPSSARTVRARRRTSPRTAPHAPASRSATRNVLTRLSTSMSGTGHLRRVERQPARDAGEEVLAQRHALRAEDLPEQFLRADERGGAAGQQHAVHLLDALAGGGEGAADETAYSGELLAEQLAQVGARQRLDDPSRLAVE